MFFGKKSKVNEYISPINGLAEALAMELNEDILYRGIVIPFILQELDAASYGNRYAQVFVKESGFSPSQYSGALRNDCLKIDGANGPQQFLTRSCMPFNDNPFLMEELRVEIVKKVIGYWGVTKDGFLFKENNQKLKVRSLVDLLSRKHDYGYGFFLDMNADLAKMMEDESRCIPEIAMPFFYARRFAAAGMYNQGIINKKEFDRVDDLQFRYTCQVGENITREEQLLFQKQSLAEALELINTYTDQLISKKLTSFFVVAAKNGISLHECFELAMEGKNKIYGHEKIKYSKNPISADSCLNFYLLNYFNFQDDLEKVSNNILSFCIEHPIIFTHELVD